VAAEISAIATVRVRQPEMAHVAKPPSNAAPRRRRQMLFTIFRICVEAKNQRDIIRLTGKSFENFTLQPTLGYDRQARKVHRDPDRRRGKNPPTTSRCEATKIERTKRDASRRSRIR
jgi:hypothetical protein